MAKWVLYRASDGLFGRDNGKPRLGNDVVEAEELRIAENGAAVFLVGGVPTHVLGPGAYGEIILSQEY